MWTTKPLKKNFCLNFKQKKTAIEQCLTACLSRVQGVFYYVLLTILMAPTVKIKEEKLLTIATNLSSEYS